MSFLRVISTSGSNITILPVEVCERIVDFIASSCPSYGYASWDVDVLNTIKACALVCRAWLLRCRHYLFQAVGVICSSSGDRTIEELLELLARNPSLRSYVRALSARSGPDELPKLHLVPMQLAPMLHELDQLHLEGGALYVPNGLALDAVMRQFSSVTELTMNGVGFYSANDLRRTVSSMISLRSLFISSPTWVTDRPARPPAARYRACPVRLNLLCISATARWTSDSRSVYFLNWLAHSGMVASLQQLDLGHLPVNDAGVLGALTAVLEHAKSTLREIDVALGPENNVSTLSETLLAINLLEDLALSVPYTAASFAQLLDIFNTASWKRLSRLSLDFITYPIAPPPPSSFTPSQSKSEPVVIVPPNFAPFPSDEDWANLDKALQLDSFKSLTKVALSSFVRETADGPLMAGWGDDDEGWIEEWIDELKSSVPGLVKKGFVHLRNHRGEVAPLI